jgi:hypothetical protein
MVVRWFLPEVLILEWELLWGSGDGVITVLREELPLFPLRIVVVAEDATSVHLPSIAGLSALACVEKPFSTSRFVELIRPCESISHTQMV